MANSKSAKKCVLQNEKRRIKNCARRSAIKTAVKIKTIKKVKVRPNFKNKNKESNAVINSTNG